VSLAQTRLRLREDFPFYARAVLKVLDRGKLVPFELRPAQLKLWTVLEGQRAQGLPMCAIVLKARKLGISTMAQGLLLQRTTLNPLHSANVIAHNGQTAGVIMQIAELMYANLPDVEDPELTLKPPVANRRRLKEIRFGEPDTFTGVASSSGRSFGANQSSYTVDTAKEFEGGRGLTLQSVHGSEVAFWTDLKRKLTVLANAVDFTDPNTLAIYESTANGFNEFKELCDKAQAGEGDFPLVFLAWFDDPRYRRRLTAREADRFEIGGHAYGEEEPELVVAYGLDFEQLQWRRWAIENLCQGDVQVFHQEYPSFPEQAFLSTGQNVFGGVLIQKAIRDAGAASTPETPRLVTFAPGAHVSRKTRRGTIEVPTAVKVTEKGPWEIWTPPSASGQYVIACDPATGEEDTDAAFAIEIIDHQTRAQVAQYEAVTEPDLVAEQLYLAALFYGVQRRPWLVVERTGGYGLAIIDTLFHEYGYRQMYTRRKPDAATGNYADRLGWDTNRQTKGLLHDEAMSLLREGTHGLRSVRLARQMETYVRKGSGRTGPLPGARSDLLLAWMIAQTVASEKAPRVAREHTRPRGPRRVRYAVTGY
jgi:hypothetical protein